MNCDRNILLCLWKAIDHIPKWWKFDYVFNFPISTSETPKENDTPYSVHTSEFPRTFWADSPYEMKYIARLEPGSLSCLWLNLWTSFSASWWDFEAPSARLHNPTFHAIIVKLCTISILLPSEINSIFDDDEPSRHIPCAVAHGSSSDYYYWPRLRTRVGMSHMASINIVHIVCTYMYIRM